KERGEERQGHREPPPPPGPVRLRPEQDQRREDQHAERVADPPGGPVECNVARREHVPEKEHGHAPGGADEARDRAAPEEQAQDVPLIVHQVIAAGAATHQRLAGDCLESRSQTEKRPDHNRPPGRPRRGQIARGHVVDAEVPQPDAGPQAAAAEQETGERDPRSRPDRRRVSRRDRQQQAEPADERVGSGKHQNLEPAPLRQDLPHAVSPGAAYPTRTLPPLTLSISPVMWLAREDARKMTEPAMSSAVAIRRRGIAASALSRPSPERASAVMSVSTHPGATALTRISGASSVDHDLVAEIIAPLLAA